MVSVPSGAGRRLRGRCVGGTFPRPGIKPGVGGGRDLRGSNKRVNVTRLARRTMVGQSARTLRATRSAEQGERVVSAPHDLGALRNAAVCLCLALATISTGGCAAKSSSTTGVTTRPSAARPSAGVRQSDLEAVGRRVAASMQGVGGPGPTFAGVLLEEADGSGIATTTGYVGDAYATFYFYLGAQADAPGEAANAAEIGARLVPAAIASPAVKAVQIVLLNQDDPTVADIVVVYDRADADKADWHAILNAADDGYAGFFTFFEDSSSYQFRNKMVWEQLWQPPLKGAPSMRTFPADRRPGAAPWNANAPF